MWVSNPKFLIPFTGVMAGYSLPIPTEMGPPIATILGLTAATAIHYLRIYGLWPFSMPWHAPYQAPKQDGCIDIRKRTPSIGTATPLVLFPEKLNSRFSGTELLTESRALTTATPWKCCEDDVRLLLEKLQQAEQIYIDSAEAVIEIHVKGPQMERISLSQCILWIGNQHNLMHLEQALLSLGIWEKHKTKFNAFLKQHFLVLNGSEIKELVKITEKRDAALHNGSGDGEMIKKLVSECFTKISIK
jgi:hypothetical protein